MKGVESPRSIGKNSRRKERRRGTKLHDKIDARRREIDVQLKTITRAEVRPINALDECFLASIEAADPDFPESFDYDPFDALTGFAQVAAQCAPGFLEEHGFPRRYEAQIAEILTMAKNEAANEPDVGDPDILRGIAERANSIAAVVQRLPELAADQGSDAHDLSKHLKRYSSKLERWADENEREHREPDGDVSDDGCRSHAELEVFDVAKLFSEL